MQEEYWNWFFLPLWRRKRDSTVHNHKTHLRAAVFVSCMKSIMMYLLHQSDRSIIHNILVACNWCIFSAFCPLLDAILQWIDEKSNNKRANTRNAKTTSNTKRKKMCYLSFFIWIVCGVSCTRKREREKKLYVPLLYTICVVCLLLLLYWLLLFINLFQKLLSLKLKSSTRMEIDDSGWGERDRESSCMPYYRLFAPI